LTARERKGLAGMGCWRKRMPGGNSPDRGCYDERIILSGGYPI